MGIVLVLTFWAVALTILAAVGAAVLGIVASALTRCAPVGRRRCIAASIVFPFACVVFAGAWFVVYALINNVAFHRDAGLGDSWETPLPNGYALMMIDVTDEGAVYNPKTQRGYDSVSSRDDAVFGVRQLQVTNGFIFGARDSGYFGRIGQYSTLVDAYFELDTIKKTHTEFKTLAELQQRATRDGTTLNLREFASVFHDFRTTWFDYIAVALLLFVPIASFMLLAIWVLRVRRGAEYASLERDTP